jgi:YHS domain-containing protein
VAQTTAPTTKPTAPASAPVSNTKCPVSGDAVDPKAKTAVYQGKTIGFCCDDCVEPFNKNPEKYAKNLK